MENIRNDPFPPKRQPTAMPVCGNKLREEELAHIARLCDYSIITNSFGTSGPVPETVADLILLDLPSILDGHAQTLSAVAAYVARHNSHILVWINMENLEEAYALLPQERCHYLVDANDMDAIPHMVGNMIAGRKSRHGKDGKFSDNGNENHFGTLHRISDELAHFAKLLNHIAEQDDDIPPPAMSDRPVTFRPANNNIFTPFPLDTPPAPHSAEITATHIRDLIKLRRMRDNHFTPDLFADPAWDILLDLFAAKLEGRQVSVSSLCIAAAVPPTTALRWIGSMTENGLLERHSDPLDARRVFIQLSDMASRKMRNFFKSVQGRPAAII